MIKILWTEPFELDHLCSFTAELTLHANSVDQIRLPNKTTLGKKIGWKLIKAVFLKNLANEH